MQTRLCFSFWLVTGRTVLFQENQSGVSKQHHVDTLFPQRPEAAAAGGAYYCYLSHLSVAP